MKDPIVDKLGNGMADDALLEKSVGGRLLAKGCTVACAESCTGGLLTSRLTDVPGSSAYVLGSIVSCTDPVKQRLVGVRAATLAMYGAVSEETAQEMAEGIRSQIQTDLGVGITGLAGPDGGTADQPIGLVYIAVAGPQGTVIKKNLFQGTRVQIKYQATQTALAMIRKYLDSV